MPEPPSAPTLVAITVSRPAIEVPAQLQLQLEGDELTVADPQVPSVPGLALRLADGLRSLVNELESGASPTRVELVPDGLALTYGRGSGDGEGWVVTLAYPALQRPANDDAPSSR
jgi:hypothetical protein